jgi:hypothetical protein
MGGTPTALRGGGFQIHMATPSMGHATLTSYNYLHRASLALLAFTFGHPIIPGTIDCGGSSVVER